MAAKLIFEQSKPGRIGCALSECDVPRQDIAKLIPGKYLSAVPAELPEVDEVTIVRHYTNLAKKNIGVDDSFYPLGSCTMKYSPKINETLASLPSFVELCPYQPEETVQGLLEILYNLSEYLKEISGLDEISIQPAAGAHGEFASLKLIRAYHRDQSGESSERKYVLIPDSAHGTNPASVVSCGYQPVEIKSDPQGNVDVEDLKARMNPQVAALMLTIPNTLGLFDKNIKHIADILHQQNAFLYMDGANFNSIMGVVKPAELGVDVLHYNLHKTFSTPHGGGGPGSGPVAVSKKLAPYLPVPTIKKARSPGGHSGLKFRWDYDRPKSIGKIKVFFGNINVLIKAYIYIRMLGPAGLKRVSEVAVLNANYIAARLKQYYHLPYGLPDGKAGKYCMHECILTGEWQLKKNGVRTLDIAKRLLDYGFHPPTIYFPLIVHEALMIEPTETESKETLDAFIEAMIAIAEECAKQPDLVKSAPHLPYPYFGKSKCGVPSVTRLDEVKAARELKLRWEGK